MSTLLLIETSALIEWGGFLIIVLFVFAETGLLLGLIVPGGESLLFTAGLLLSTRTLEVHITTLLLSVILAAFAGDILGFYIGRRFKERLYKKKDSWYFKKKYVTLAEKYIEKHKKSSLILGKFLPVIRPFTPAITGTTRMNFMTFIPVSLAAIVLYVGTFTLSGFLFGSQFPQIKDYLGLILPISILVALIPVLIQIRKHKKNPRATRVS